MSTMLRLLTAIFGGGDVLRAERALASVIADGEVGRATSASAIEAMWKSLDVLDHAISHAKRLSCDGGARRPSLVRRPRRRAL